MGICSALTFTEADDSIYVLNWAISCRYFEIGLEEYILMFILTFANKRAITFDFNDTGFNGKVITLIEKYKNSFIMKNGKICFFKKRIR